MTSTQKGGEEVLKFVVCLQVLLFLNNRSIVLFCKSGVSAGEEGGGVKKSVIFCRYHNWMIPNVKRVMFLALVLVLQWNSHPQFLVQVCSRWKAYNLKHFQLSRMAPKCAIANLYSSKNYCGKKLKICHICLGAIL